MKTRTTLYLVLAAVILTLAIAAPALAEDSDTLMWVERNRLAWNGRSSGGTDRIVAKIHVFDANNAMVEGAAVVAVWTLPDGSTKEALSVTAFQGIAEFAVERPKVKVGVAVGRIFGEDHLVLFDRGFVVAEGAEEAC